MADTDTNNRWNALLRASRLWQLEWNVADLLARIAKESVELLALERGILFLLDRNGISARAIYPPSVNDKLASDKALAYSRTVAQQVIQSGQPLFAHEISNADAGKGDIGHVFCVPLTATRGILGALYLDSRLSNVDFSHHDHEFIEMLGLQAAVAAR